MHYNKYINLEKTNTLKNKGAKLRVYSEITMIVGLPRCIYYNCIKNMVFKIGNKKNGSIIVVLDLNKVLSEEVEAGLQAWNTHCKQ